MFKIFLLSTFIFLSATIFASSKIYLIRHAEVNIEKPGWCNAQTAYNYRQLYNINPVMAFDAQSVLNKIDHPETIDTVFCSPQSRALQTAVLLFNTQAKFRINENLMELNYPIIQFPVIKLPVRVRQTISLLSWMAGNNKYNKLSYKYIKQSLEIYSKELISYAENHGKAVVVAHGVLNHELIKILKKEGWKFEHRDGYGNLSVNCMVKE